MLDDFKILDLGIEVLVRILGASHGVLAHLCLSHLLCHLCGGFVLLASRTQLATTLGWCAGEDVHTIITPQNEIVDRLQSKQRKEIPAQTAHPSHIQIPRPDTSLQHLLKLRREREG